MPLLSTRGAASARGFGLFGRVKALADPFFNYVTMLLHGDGTNGAQNNTFLDSSTNNFTITRNGNTTQGSFSPYGPNWSNYFLGAIGSPQYLTIASNTNLNLTGDYTVECWYLQNFEFNPTGYGLIFGTTLGTVGPNEVSFFIEYPGAGFNWGSLNSGISPVPGTWYHLAATKSGSTTRLFVNGALAASSTSADTPPSGVNWYIGSRPIGSSGGVYSVNGYISNCRIIKGTAIYTAAFTPPTAPLTAVSGTQLLTCQSNRFIDNSANNFALGITGTPSVQRFSPFAPPAAYSPATIGGSGYFDGSGDFLSAPNNSALDLGSGDFTIEGWWYFTDTSNQALVSKYTGFNGYVVQYQSNNLRLVLGLGGSDVVYSFAWTATANTWNHVAITRSGTSGRAFINGVQIGSTTTVTTSNTVGSTTLQIGSTHTVSELTRGYVSDFRLVKGTAVYTSTFTPPTAPVTAITNTQLLTNFTNGAIFDNAMMNNLETVGNAQINTSVKKYGTGSIALDGTGDYVVEPTNLNFGYGTGDFTIEFWLYLNSTGLQTIVSSLSSGSSTNPHIYITTTIRYYTAGADRITGASLSTGQWYHIALCRASGSTRLFVDGTQSGSTYSDANNYGASAPLGIGTYWDSGAPATSNTLNGYIDDLRITKGYARYTANFTPPTAAFPDQ